MTSPLLPLEALVGYTVTTLDSITYTLTPATKGTRTMTQTRQCCARPHCPAGSYGHTTSDYTTEHLDDGRRFHYCTAGADQPNPDDDYQSRAEWREVPQ